MAGLKTEKLDAKSLSKCHSTLAPLVLKQRQKLDTAAARARTQDPEGLESNANVKLFKALAELIFETVPIDPNRDEYRQGNTMGYRFSPLASSQDRSPIRLFFRFDSKTKIIIFAWVNDGHRMYP